MQEADDRRCLVRADHAVYNSDAYNGQSGWLVFGGKARVRRPIAAICGLAGNAVSNASSYIYVVRSRFAT